jgi:hypothetical protein
MVVPVAWWRPWRSRRDQRRGFSVVTAAETKQVEVLSETSNYAIVRMPGRNFPGSVIQGDSLYILVGLARKIQTEAASSHNEELTDAAAELLEDRIEYYETVLAAHNIDLPYI